MKRGVRGVSSAISPFLGGPSFELSDSTCVCIVLQHREVCVCVAEVCVATHTVRVQEPFERLLNTCGRILHYEWPLMFKITAHTAIQSE